MLYEIIRGVEFDKTTESQVWEISEKFFWRLSNLRRHKKSTHDRTSEVKCPKCNKKLNRANDIKYHKSKQIKGLSVMKDSLSVLNEAALS